MSVSYLLAGGGIAIAAAVAVAAVSAEDGSPPGDSVPAGSGGAAEACEKFVEMEGHEVTHPGEFMDFGDNGTVRAYVRTGGQLQGLSCWLVLDDGRWWLVAFR